MVEVIKTYSYWDNIKSAKCGKNQKVEQGQCMGLNAGGSNDELKRNRIGLESYLSALQYGYYNAAGGNTVATNANGGKGGPMGNRYFFSTGGKCLDKSQNEQDRYKYMNNIPNSSWGTQKGIVPGMIGNVGKLSPMIILLSLIHI